MNAVEFVQYQSKLHRADQEKRARLTDAARRDPRTFEQAMADFRSHLAEDRRLTDERNERESFARFGAAKAADALATEASTAAALAEKEPLPKSPAEGIWPPEAHRTAWKAYEEACAAREKRISEAYHASMAANLRAQIAYLKALAAERPRFPDLDAAIDAARARVDADDARVHLLTGSWASRYL